VLAYAHVTTLILCFISVILSCTFLVMVTNLFQGAKDVMESLLDCVIAQLVSQASKVVRTRAWHLLDDAMQAPILEKAGFPRRRQDGPLQVHLSLLLFSRRCGKF